MEMKIRVLLLYVWSMALPETYKQILTEQLSLIAAGTSYQKVTECWRQLIHNHPVSVQWSLYVPYSGHYMYQQFNIQQFYVLPTQCIYVFCVDLRKKTAIISLYSINLLVFITQI